MSLYYKDSTKQITIAISHEKKKEKEKKETDS